VVLGLIMLITPVRAASFDSAQDVISKYAAVWNALQSYTCTWTVHEAKNSAAQDRVYHIYFQKPLNTRAEVVAGDGKGSVAVWDGGDRVRGHQGGILSLIRLNLDIHNHLAVSLRGATIAQLNMGSLLGHLQSIDLKNFQVTQQGSNSILSTPVQEAPPDTDVVKEVYTFAPNGLPIESFQYGANNVVLKHVVVSDYKLNVALPASTWQI
jgi:hypothetical protein